MEQTANPLAKTFGFRSLLAFAFPNIVMMVFLSLYTIVDGMFISRFVGTTALSALNMIYPANCIELALGIMVATGGSAVIARRLGEKKEQQARENFTFLVLVEFSIGVAIAALGNLWADEIIAALGATPAQFAICRTYARILFAFAPAFFLQVAFQSYFVTAGRPALGLLFTVAAGATNILLDYLFIVPCGMGIAGAAIATGIGFCIPATAGIVFFSRRKKCDLYFALPRRQSPRGPRVRPFADWRMLLGVCANGSSEMVTNLATGVTTFLFNWMFLTYYGEDGVAAITIVLYFQFVFAAIHFGYAGGVAPVISYKFGSGDTRQLQAIFKISLWFVLACSVATWIVSRLTIAPALAAFTVAGSNVYQITLQGFALFSWSFWFSGLGIFASSAFTALSNGKVSATISFARTFAFLVGCILLLPLLFAETGLWLSVPIAEALGCLVAVIFLLCNRKKYQY